MNVIKQWFNQEHNNITVNAKLISNPLFFHFFLSHYQANAGDSINLLAAELKHFQVRCWTDKGDVEVNADGMKKGIKESKAYILFLSKDCLSRQFVILELREAIELKKPIILLHETEMNRPSFATFEESMPRRFEIHF